jgi:hypothetical protein
MSINKKFEEIVNFCLDDVDEVGDDIIFEESTSERGTRMFRDQMPPLVFPFGYMIISSTFMYYDDEDEDGYEE